MLVHINRIFQADRDLLAVSMMRLEIHNKDPPKKINPATTSLSALQHCKQLGIPPPPLPLVCTRRGKQKTKTVVVSE